jgi:Txe/YoeB family toxin of Txe-Axe toxin-antitoxin module
MSRYQCVLEDRFVRNQRRYRSLQEHIQRHVDQVLDDPYRGTERLGKRAGGLDLRGCRSVRVTRNFRIILSFARSAAACQSAAFASARGCRTRPWSFSP